MTAVEWRSDLLSFFCVSAFFSTSLTSIRSSSWPIALFSSATHASVLRRYHFFRSLVSAATSLCTWPCSSARFCSVFFFLMMASESISVISFRRDVIAQLSRFLRFPRDVLRVYRVAVAFTYLFLVFFYLFHRVIPVLRNGGRMSSFSFHLASELIRTLDRFYRVFFLVTFLSALICFFFQFQATTFTALLMAELSRIAVFFLPFFLRTSYLLLDRLDVSWFLGLSKR